MNYSFDILSQISGSKNRFTPAEKKIYDFVLNDPHAVLPLSISQLAANCRVSLATVTRFCRRVNLNGYPELRMEIAKAISATNESPDIKDTEILPEDSLDEVTKKLYNTHAGILNRAKDALDLHQLSRAVALLYTADSVYFYGAGNMMLVAYNAKIQFLRNFSKFHSEIDPQLQALSANLMSEKSVAVIFSYSGATYDIVEIAKLAKTRGAKIIAVSRHLQSPLAALADVLLLCGVTEAPLQPGSAGIKTAMNYITDVLFTEYARHSASERPEESNSVSAIWKNSGKKG